MTRKQVFAGAVTGFLCSLLWAEIILCLMKGFPEFGNMILLLWMVGIAVMCCIAMRVAKKRKDSE